MNRNLIVLTLVGALVTPTALATVWHAAGEYEPNTAYDTATWMWQEPPGSATDRIYFHAYVSQGTVSMNPNSATLGTRVFPHADTSVFAQLGVWRDCNGDGYIGLGDNGVSDYPDDVLDAAGKARCPRETYDPARMRGYHNLNGTVDEMVMIAHVGEGAALQSKRVIGDKDARVWGDEDLPGGNETTSGGGTCPLTPLPKGTMQTTGGFLNYATCVVGTGADWNAAMNFLTIVSGNTAPQGLKMSNPEDWKTLPMGLGTIQTAGNDHSSNSNAHIYDCSSQAMLFNESHQIPDTGVAQVDDRTGFVNASNRMPAPSADPNRPFTIAGQVNATMEEAGGDCDTTNDAGHDVYVLESEHERNIVTTQTPKRVSDWVFNYFGNQRTNATATSNTVKAFTGSHLPVDEVQNGQVTALLSDGYYSSAGLLGDTTATDGLQSLSRRAFLNCACVSGAVGFNFTARYYVWYAAVGTNATAAPLNLKTPSLGVSEGNYGSEWCDVSEDWRHNGGFDCDGANWYLNSDGTPQAQKPGRAIPGSPYQFKDFDCFDFGTTRGGAKPVTGGVNKPDSHFCRDSTVPSR